MSEPVQTFPVEMVSSMARDAVKASRHGQSNPEETISVDPIKIELSLDIEGLVVNSEVCVCQRKWCRLTAVVLTLLALCGLFRDQFASFPASSQHDADLLPRWPVSGRRLRSKTTTPIPEMESMETQFCDMEIAVPLLILMTAAAVNACSVLTEAEAKVTLSGVGLSAGQLIGFVLKMLCVDSVDQLISIYLVMWCQKSSVGDGIKALAWIAVLFGVPSFFASIPALQVYLVKKDFSALQLANVAGLAADLCSVGAMALIELTAKEEDLLPGWLKVMDFLWSILSIMAEVGVIVSGLSEARAQS